MGPNLKGIKPFFCLLMKGNLSVPHITGKVIETNYYIHTGLLESFLLAEGRLSVYLGLFWPYKRQGRIEQEVFFLAPEEKLSAYRTWFL